MSTTLAIKTLRLEVSQQPFQSGHSLQPPITVSDLFHHTATSGNALAIHRIAVVRASLPTEVVPRLEYEWRTKRHSDTQRVLHDKYLDLGKDPAKEFDRLNHPERFAVDFSRNGRRQLVIDIDLLYLETVRRAEPELTLNAPLLLDRDAGGMLEIFCEAHVLVWLYLLEPV